MIDIGLLLVAFFLGIFVGMWMYEKYIVNTKC